MISTILFDADGVLVNSERFSTQLARDYPVDQAKVAEFFTEYFPDCLVGKADLKEAISPYLAGFGWSKSVDELLEYWFTVEHHLNEPLIEYIQKLRAQGMYIAVATNNEKYRAQYMLDQMGFSDSFDALYASAHLGHKKPAIEFFKRVVEDIDVAKDEVLFWDDDAANIAGAHEYGIQAEFYKDYEQFLATMKTYSLQ